MVTVLTPTYNRAYIIENAYKSLLKQTNKDFEWLIIDDGSTDDTKEKVNKFIKNKKINIRYFYKKNGGKHTALNDGVKKAKGDLILILDSDDYLTDDCIDKIYKYWSKYESDKNICALSFLRIYPNGQVIGKRYKGTEIISNNIEFKYNRGCLGDMQEVYRKDVLKKYPFPVYEKERFLSEAIVWNKIALDYDTVYINEPICVCEYLEDGLSRNLLKIRINNPVGALENSKIFLNKKFKLSIRLKNGILYTGFSKLSNKKMKEIISYSKYKFLILITYIPGIMFYLYLKTRKFK